MSHASHFCTKRGKPYSVIPWTFHLSHTVVPLIIALPERPSNAITRTCRVAECSNGSSLHNWQGVISFVQNFHENVRTRVGRPPGVPFASHGIQSVAALAQRTFMKRITWLAHLIVDNMVNAGATLIFEHRQSSELQRSYIFRCLSCRGFTALGRT